MIEIRPAKPEDRAAIVEILHHGWHDGHAHLVSPEVLPLRTLECIDDIYGASEDVFYVAQEKDRILGFVAINGDELTKLFIARNARGSGVAEKLMAFGEARIAENGFAVARLLCQVGNVPAEKFYARTGWVEDHRRQYPLWMPKGATGHFTAETMCLLKKVGPGPQTAGS
ncbi:GNAT family N-acetyltransferase [Hoeflea sp.]|uniref:GNAT family N-acetyltransferase n=1 Tax=Hoeflea sp. TaxID=1940281 RepID=UPI0019B88319|nr:GNAT family N-acetyltransferase [Hoeflea sp.]MBC7279960.1 GNAT family N-acetyltransferase [Hoeflea sp.]